MFLKLINRSSKIKDKNFIVKHKEECNYKKLDDNNTVACKLTSKLLAL